MNKKFFSVLLIAVLTVSYANAQFTFGARAGFNLTNMSGFNDDNDELEFDFNTKLKPGFQFGVVGDFALNKSFSIQPGILFATQGFKISEDFISFIGSVPVPVSLSGGLSLNYIQIPINVQYKIDLGDMKLLLQTGSYLGYGLSGKLEVEATSGNFTYEEKEKMKFGNKEEDMNPFDFGLGFGVGLHFDNIQVGLGYNLGLANLSKVENISTKHSGLALTVTYLFGK